MNEHSDSNHPSAFCYLGRLAIENFQGIPAGALQFLDPHSTQETELRNVNLIVGDNGSGKSSILKAAAVAILGPLLDTLSPEIKRRLVRKNSVAAVCDGTLKLPDRTVNVKTSIDPNGIQSQGPGSPLTGIFLCAYGAHSRLAEPARPTPDPPSTDGATSPTSISESPSPQGGATAPLHTLGFAGPDGATSGTNETASHARSLSREHQRVANLFVDGHSLKPLSYLGLLCQKESQRRQILNIINSVLDNTGFLMTQLCGQTSIFANSEGLPQYDHELPDGHRSFLALVVDLLCNLCEVDPNSPHQVAGIVLIDQLEHNLHPRWQLTVLPKLSRNFPKIQFIVTTNSPLVVASLPPGQIHRCGRQLETGKILVEKPALDLYRSPIQEVLTSPLFDLESGPSPGSRQHQRDLLRRVGHHYLLSQPPPTEPTIHQQIPGRIIEEAQAQARQLVRDAEQAAKNMLSEYHRQAQAMLEQVNQLIQEEALNVRTRAQQEGYQEGFQQGLQAASKAQPPDPE